MYHFGDHNQGCIVSGETQISLYALAYFNKELRKWQPDGADFSTACLIILWTKNNI